MYVGYTSLTFPQQYYMGGGQAVVDAASYKSVELNLKNCLGCYLYKIFYLFIWHPSRDSQSIVCDRVG
jgi:hypothetical protein